MSLLIVVANRWKIIAGDLGLHKDKIEDIDGDNDNNEACLQECVKHWIEKMDSSWKKLSCVLYGLGEEDLAKQANREGEKIN